MATQHESFTGANLVLKTNIEEIAPGSESWTAEEAVRWTLERYGNRAAIVTSLQAEGMVILDMALTINPGARILTIDTGRLPAETYELMEKVQSRYERRIEVLFPDHAELSGMVNRHGVNAFYKSVAMRQLCCYVRKVSPLNRALAGLDAWVTGLTRSQSNTRSSTPKVMVDIAHNDIIKVNPLADWSNGQIWDYIKSRNLPHNELYEKGYTSIGCAPCTRPVKPGDSPRAGRWWWETDAPKECGIHLSSVISHGD